MKKIVLVVGSLLCVWSGLTQELRSAGTLLVDLSADTITANDGDAIAQWANSGGSLGGVFAAVTNNAGVGLGRIYPGGKVGLSLMDRGYRRQHI